MFESLRLRNFLSFGPDSKPFVLQPLNVIIGPNGSGKSNLIEGLAMLRGAPGNLTAPIREGSGTVRDWLWKGGAGPVAASIEAVLPDFVSGADPAMALRYFIEFTESGGRFTVVDETVENAVPFPSFTDTNFYFRYQNNRPVLSVRKIGDQSPTMRFLQREDVDPERSILAQRRDPDGYPELTRLSESLEGIRIYRDWSFGRLAPPRLPQPTDLPNGTLDESGRNLGLVLNRLKRNAAARALLLEKFRAVYEDARDIDLQVEGGTCQVFVQEERFNVPATRLSDGTLRFLCLLAVLYDPTPPPLICFDEPDLGLHPDLIHLVADALRHASQHSQVIVTTHSTVLVDAFHDDPSAIVVCEKHDACTTLERLDGNHLGPWLAKYRLADLWTSGELGGTRW